MLPDRPGKRVVVVRRTLDVAEDDLVDAITAFAVDQDLELDRRYEEGLLFRRAHEARVGVKHLFDRFDGLRVHITPTDAGHDVEFLADLRGSAQTNVQKRRGEAIGSAGVAALFAWLGVRGLIATVGLMDFVFLGLSVMFGSRAVGQLQSPEDDFDEIERNVVNELNRVCDDALFRD